MRLRVQFELNVSDFSDFGCPNFCIGTDSSFNQGPLQDCSCVCCCEMATSDTARYLFGACQFILVAYTIYIGRLTMNKRYFFPRRPLHLVHSWSGILLMWVSCAMSTPG